MNFQNHFNESALNSKNGQNYATVKQYNRCLVLREIACNGPVSRVELSERLGLTKTALGKIVSELIEKKLIEEITTTAQEDASPQASIGRPPIMLSVSAKAPVICGILIKRRFFTICIADLSGKIIRSQNQKLPADTNAQSLLLQLLTTYQELTHNLTEQIMAIGIACVGPVDVLRGEILTPPNFYGISHVKICDYFKKHTGLPCYLISDSSSGALAEKTYGSAKLLPNYIYLHIMDGIGSGYILNNRLYDGARGLTGEIGHTTINFSGPRCSCGNIGCLELYANTARLQSTIQNLEEVYHRPCPYLYTSKEKGDLKLEEVIYAASKESTFAIIALQEFCEYLATGVVNLINILNINDIIVGYDGVENQTVFEEMLREKVSKRIVSNPEELTIRRSIFHGDAPLIGSIALIANKVFDSEINLL